MSGNQRIEMKESIGDEVYSGVARAGVMRMAKLIEELEAQVCGLVGLLREAMPYVKDCADWGREHDCDLRDLIDEALSGKLQDAAEPIFDLSTLPNYFDIKSLKPGAIFPIRKPYPPEGWTLVPIEPTKAMCEAFHEAHEGYESGINWRLDSPDHQWAAMLAAAPKPDAKP